MVRSRCASRQGKFREGGLSRGENIVGREASPDRVERFEPVEEVGILRGRDGAGEGLVEVMMRVDESREEDVTFEVKGFVGVGGQIGSLSYLFDESVFDKKTTIREFGVAVVHGEEVGVFDEEGGHRRSEEWRIRELRLFGGRDASSRDQVD